MTVMMKEYESSDPSTATRQMKGLRQNNRLCPMCGRVAKWYYNFYESTSKKDKPYRCALHEITPLPGPTSYPDYEKCSQLY